MLQQAISLDETVGLQHTHTISSQAAIARRQPVAWSRTLANDFALSCTALAGFVATYGVYSAQPTSTTTAATSLALIFGLFLAVFCFAFRTSISAFQPNKSVTSVALVTIAASALALTLQLAIEEATVASASWMFLLGSLAAGITAALATFLTIGLVYALDPVNQVFRRRIAVFGATIKSFALLEDLHADQTSNFVGLFDDRSTTGRFENTVTPICGTLETMVRMVEQGQIDEILICLPSGATERNNRVAELLSGYPVDVHVILEDTFPSLLGKGLRKIGNARMVQIHQAPLHDWGRVGKEALDRIGAAVLLVCLSPFFAMIAAAIKWNSKGPVFFRQRRHGLMGRTIIVWKFRSMTCAEDGPEVRQAQKNDARVTKVGAILRKTSLDELPQLINVLFGEMSLVGPRPHAIAHNEQYSALIEHYDHRNQVKPGITGWAQVNGLRGETSTTAEMEQRVAHDLAYIGNWSIWFDIKVILLTPIYGFVNRNAY